MPQNHGFSIPAARLTASRDEIPPRAPWFGAAPLIPVELEITLRDR
ncbi:MAG: hypothetical protein RRC34_03785 [Lentisphaeria bacterium]|nr:hypothetical protein [Lentisphaeria bacterium]